MKKRFYWTQEQINRLRELYPRTLSADLAELFGCSLRSIYNQANRQGLKKDVDFIAEISRIKMKDINHPARKHWIKKGNIPANKGKKWDDYMPKDSQRKSKTTTFKKGHIPHNTKKDGEVVVRQRKDRNDPPYKMVKVAGERKLILLHRYVWEQHNGPIPEGFNIIFKNGDTTNCDISNLQLVSNSELMNMNTIHRYPSELKSTIKALGKLKKAINHVKEHNIRP